MSGTKVAVLHYRPQAPTPSLLVELPDHTAQCLPLSWTDRATPDPFRTAIPHGARLSGLALLELVRLVEKEKVNH